MIIAADALFSLMVLILIACLYYGPWQSVCTDYARQLIFERRDRLFDMAMNGKLDFESVEYRETRKFLERAIRYAHELTLPSLLYISSRLDPSEKKIAIEGLDASIAAITNKDVRNQVNSLVGESLIILMVMMVAKTLLLAIPMTAILVIGRLRQWLRKCFGESTAVKVVSKSIQAGAYWA